MTVKHTVWPTPVPPVCTAFWDQRSWDSWADLSKPEDYHGDRYSQSDWEEYMRNKDNSYVNEQSRRMGVSSV